MRFTFLKLAPSVLPPRTIKRIPEIRTLEAVSSIPEMVCRFDFLEKNAVSKPYGVFMRVLLITHVESFRLSPIPLSFGTIRAAATTTCFRVRGLMYNSELKAKILALELAD